MIHRRSRNSFRRTVPAGLALFILACGSRSKLPAPVVEYSGCWAVSLPGPKCLLYRDEHRLKLWVKADPGAQIEIRAGGERLPAAGEEAQEGRRFRLSLPLEVSPLTVRLLQADGSRSPPWSIDLVWMDKPSWWREIAELGRRGTHSEVRRRLMEIRATAPPGEQGLLLRSLAYLAQAEGNDEEAADFLRRGMAADHAERLLSGEAEKATLLARLYVQQGRFDAAREVLSALHLSAAAPADTQYEVAFYRGLAASRVGDYRTALEQLRAAVDIAARGGMQEYHWKAEQALANLLQSLGLSERAAELFASLRTDPHPETRCDLGTLLTNEAWSKLLAREGGDTAVADPTPELQQARDIYDTNRECRPAQRFNARLNLALAHQQAGRHGAARQALEEIRRLAPQTNVDLKQRLWWLDLEGRQAIAEGRPEQALRTYGELAKAAARALSPEGRFRAATGRANAEIALGERAAAIADLAAADRLLDEQTWLIPADQGRDTFIAQRERATRLYLQILLDQGERQRAFLLARHARSRLLRQLAVRDRLARLTPVEQSRWDAALSRYWSLRSAIDRRAAEEWQIPEDRLRRAQEDRAAQLAAARRDLDAAMASLHAPRDPGTDSLSPPGPGEVILTYHPLPDGWAGFAADGRDVEVSRFQLLPGADPARVLLAPFRSVLARAERVRVLPYGPLRAVDFHALPFAGEPLLAQAAVVYSLDLPSPSNALPERPTALLVADAEGNLPAARQEAEAVGRALQAWGRGWALQRLEGTEAGARAVLPVLGRADLFHFAGHGDFAGFAGWDSALRLSDGTRLTLSDLLALPRVPSWVVLSACDGGHSSEQAPGEGVGLAQAFLLAGTRSVIAATRPVLDRTARDLLTELYRRWQPGTDPAQALRQAQLACRSRNPDADWASFRLLTP
jgi:tetratricopeptide (TPR) repeat protein